jgi:signal transduction histidine kinase
MKRSLRWRLAWTFTLLSTFAVLIQAIALFVSTDEQEEDLTDEVVNATLDSYLRQDAHGAAPEFQLSSPRMKLYRGPVGTVPTGLPARLTNLPPGNHEWFIGEVEYHVGIRDVGRERVYLMYDVRDHEARLDQLQWNLLIGLLVLSLISLSLGYWLAGRLLFQLEKMTRSLQRDDFTPLNEPGLDREVALLAGALDAYRRRNRELLAREREFTANVSHELRTPLTRIRTSAELLGEDSTLSGRSKERAARIVGAVDALEAKLRGLLFLGREMTIDEKRPLELKRQVEVSAAPFRAACEAAGVVLRIDVPDDVIIDADASLLQLLLDNLIGNAVRYTPSGCIDIVCLDGELRIEDTGVGIRPEDLAHVFDRHYRASDVPGGMGIGLSIVKRVCDAHGWTCGIESLNRVIPVGETPVMRSDAAGVSGTRVTVRFAASRQAETLRQQALTGQ